MSTAVRLLMMGIVTLLLTCASTAPVYAMGQESFGPAGEHIGRTAEWPKGVEDVLRHPSRVYWNWVNGNEHAYYDGDLEKINQLLDLFAQVDLQVHHVIVRPGRPSARSFRGLLVEHNVEFEIPSGIYLHHVQQLTATGLYSAVPRMTIHIDDALMQSLDELKVPTNVYLQALPYRVEDALAQLDSSDRSLRSRAITVLGQAGDASQKVIDALDQAAADADEHISKVVQESRESIKQATDPSQRALREHIDGFLRNHPQRSRTPRPQELLEVLRKVDAKYAQEFTARGTTVQPTTSGRDKLVAWTVTMGNDRLVIQRKAVVDENHPRTEDLLENTLYAGPNRMGTIHQSRLWVDGKLIDTTPHASFEPVGSTYDLLIGRVLWPIGRGFTSRIDRITLVTAQADGNLTVNAESDGEGLQLRWELLIDPHADYLVRHAKAYRRDAETPMYIVDNIGVQSVADRYTAHTARWIEGAEGQPISISVHFVSAQADTELIDRTKERLNSLN